MNSIESIQKHIQEDVALCVLRSFLPQGKVRIGTKTGMQEYISSELINILGNNLQNT